MRSHDGAAGEILDAGECLRLLASVPVGRLVFTHGGLPVIRLVNFLVDTDTIVFASDDSEWVRSAHRGDVVAFEVDDFDPSRRLGWTVTSIGHLSVVPAAEAADLERIAPSWVGLRGRPLFRLGVESLSGRRASIDAQGNGSEAFPNRHGLRTVAR
ncbi:pyridoxamine 5'-phosphate oxidase family protein [Kribbella sp. NBC_00359]|uniref:pyridoxamine 5'-phosphate oxidase family protein n=1 Tax=Kribbella sp. NBC_00359 TaxID=2975966 RepID=UPI002E2380E9